MTVRSAYLRVHIKRRTLYVFILLLFVLGIAVAFYVYNLGFFLGDVTGFIVADSKYYFEMSKDISGLPDLAYLVHKNKNLFGPLFYFRFILQNQLWLFFVVNFFLFVQGFLALNKYLTGVRKRLAMLTIIACNPAILSAFSGPNKEITGFLSVLFIINYLLSGSRYWIVGSLILALLTRFEMFLVIICFLIIRHFRKLDRFLLLFMLIPVISAVIYAADYSHMGKLLANERAGSLGLIQFMATLNQNGLFFLTFPLKLVINLFGSLFALNFFSLKGYPINLYISQLIFLVLSVLIFKKKALNLSNNLFLLVSIYAIVFCVPSYVQHRYFLVLYPAFVVMALVPREFLLRQIGRKKFCDS